MNPEVTDRTGLAIQRAVDFIEANLASALCIERIAAAAHFSPYHFARLFRAQTGFTPMGYVRARRLTEAVTLLRDTQMPVQDVALQVGFASQQSFTSAFSERFAVPPATFRSEPFVVKRQEKIDMSSRFKYIPTGPVFRERPGFVVAGYTLVCGEQHGTQHIPALWQRFAPHIGSIPGQYGAETFGVCFNMDRGSGAFTYMAGAPTQNPRACTGFELCEVPAAHYAVFTHHGSLSHIHETVGYIFGEWLPESGHTLAETPDFELYDARFDPIADSGELEYWVPIIMA